MANKTGATWCSPRPPSCSQSTAITASGCAEIGDAVGIRGPSLYHYFPSKADLLSAITLASTTEFIDAHLPPFEHDPNVLGALRRMLRAHILYFREHRVEQKVSLPRCRRSVPSTRCATPSPAAAGGGISGR